MCASHAACDCSKTPAVYKPVCGADFWTYGNECVAKCANVMIAHNGACPKCKPYYGSEFPLEVDMRRVWFLV